MVNKRLERPNNVLQTNAATYHILNLPSERKWSKHVLWSCNFLNRSFSTVFTFYIALSSVKCRPLGNRGLFVTIRTEKITKERIWIITREGTWRPRGLGHLEEAVGHPVIAGKSGCMRFYRWPFAKMLCNLFSKISSQNNFSHRLSSGSKGGVSGSSVSLTTPQVRSMISWSSSKRGWLGES